MNENTQSQTDLDPLSMPAGDVDTRFPRLQPDRVYRMVVADAENDESKSTPGNRLLTFKLSTTKDEVDTDGKTLHSGFPIYHRITITPTKERSSKDIARDCALILKATGKASVSPKELIDNPALLKDQLVDVKVGLQKAKDGFPESNKVSSFVLPS